MGCCSSSKASQPQQQTVKAKDPSEAVPLNEKDNSNHQQKIIDALKEIQLFASLNDNEKKKISSQLKSKTFKSGENLMKQGDNGKDFYVIVSGKCKVVVASEEKETEIAVLKPGGK